MLAYHWVLWVRNRSSYNWFYLLICNIHHCSKRKLVTNINIVCISFNHKYTIKICVFFYIWKTKQFSLTFNMSKYSCFLTATFFRLSLLCSQIKNMWSTFGWHAAAKWPTTSVLLLVAAKKKMEKIVDPKRNEAGRKWLEKRDGKFTKQAQSEFWRIFN